MFDPWKELVTLTKTPVKPRPDNKICPNVGAIIIGQGLKEPIQKYHSHEKGKLVCRHAEELAIEDLLGKRNQQIIDFSKCDFYTSLEPCNLRGHYQVPCAHRIATMGFNSIYIGMMDPDPDIYGHGVAYLIENLGRGNVYYAPKKHREEIRSINKKFVNDKQQKFDFEKFVESFPVFTGIDEEMYLRLSHALFRMFGMEKDVKKETRKIVWLFSRLPTFADRHKFQAVWAEGMLENKKLDEIWLIMHKEHWEEDIATACKQKMQSTLLGEFKDRQKPKIKLFISRKTCETDCLCKTFAGGLLIKGEEIVCLVIPSYSKVLHMFLACEPKYLSRLRLTQGGKKQNELKQTDVQQIIKELKSIYTKAIGEAVPYENFYTQLKNQINNAE